ncbi:MAG: hypothetical protein JG782_1944 [Anaerophaga sp.]|nr:hypothetical protein [Anaerophaga sp.]
MAKASKYRAPKQAYFCLYNLLRKINDCHCL